MIKDEVQDGHLARHPEEGLLLKKLEPDFDITWASKITKFNTDVSIYFIKPKPHLTQAFGFEQELVLAISDYAKLEARLIQAVEQTFQQLPAKGRVDQTVALVISAASNTEKWIHDYVSQNPQTRAYVGIARQDLASTSDSWFLRNKLSSQLFSRDLFDYTLPLNEDLFFFGRQAIVAEHIDAIRRSENRGLFGLRKTGKTSVLFKIRRNCIENEIQSLYYDCKLPSLYRLSGDDLLHRICEDIKTELNLVEKPLSNARNASDRFTSLIKSMPEDKRLCLLLDEIEYISPTSKLGPHWKDDFVPFWQTIWSAQSQFRKFSFVLAGVNASIVEVDRVAGVQNPIFGIVRTRYLTGFDKDEVRTLLTVFGKRMGIRFDASAVDALFARYGGHPLLTRMACSQINNSLKVSGAVRPCHITKQTVFSDIESREEDIQFYCGHITSELEEFYSDEFDMLELLASGDVVGFNELSSEIDYVRHLRSYGLIDFSRQYQPEFKIPIIKSYIAAKWRRRNGLRIPRHIVPSHRRKEFVEGRAASILREMRAAEKRFTSLGLPQLYAGSGPSEAELFADISVCDSRNDLVAFLNQTSRSIVEPLDGTGKRLKKEGYFFKELKITYTRLWPALNRARAYRNHFLHLDLTKIAEEQFRNFLETDLDGSIPDELSEGWFQLQSAVLNGLLIGIQAELAVYD